jgi:hypothetical protein
LKAGYKNNKPVFFVIVHIRHAISSGAYSFPAKMRKENFNEIELFNYSINAAYRITWMHAGAAY